MKLFHVASIACSLAVMIAGATTHAAEDVPLPLVYGGDSFSIVNTSVEGDILHVEVRYGGGCAQHDFDRSWWRIAKGDFIGKENTWAVEVHLVHRGNWDPCEAYRGSMLRVDLRMIVDAIREHYQGTEPIGHGTLTIRVLGDDKTARSHVALYRF